MRVASVDRVTSYPSRITPTQRCAEMAERFKHVGDWTQVSAWSGGIIEATLTNGRITVFPGPLGANIQVRIYDSADQQIGFGSNKNPDVAYESARLAAREYVRSERMASLARVKFDKKTHQHRTSLLGELHDPLDFLRNIIEFGEHSEMGIPPKFTAVADNTVAFTFYITRQPIGRDDWGVFISNEDDVTLGDAWGQRLDSTMVSALLAVRGEPKELEAASCFLGSVDISTHQGEDHDFE